MWGWICLLRGRWCLERRAGPGQQVFLFIRWLDWEECMHKLCPEEISKSELRRRLQPLGRREVSDESRGAARV